MEMSKEMALENLNSISLQDYDKNKEAVTRLNKIIKEKSK